MNAAAVRRRRGEMPNPPMERTVPAGKMLVGRGRRVVPARQVNAVVRTRFMMRLEQIDHVALRCASLEATKAWYVSTLGFEHVFPGQWSGVPIVLRLGSTF